MTTERQKRSELEYARRFAQVLGKSWRIKPCECPDLLVWTEHGEFGLEVTELYLDTAGNGSKKRGGSKKKRNEGKHSEQMKNVSRDYYKKPGYPPVMVTFLDDLDRADQILQSLREAAPQLAEWECKVVHPYASCRMRVRRLPDTDQFQHYRRGWHCRRDMGGMVGRLRGSTIQARIDTKAGRLRAYQQKTPIVRLLMVSNATRLSGMADVTCIGGAHSGALYNRRGFERVYHYYYPYDDAWELTPNGTLRLCPP